MRNNLDRLKCLSKFFTLLILIPALLMGCSGSLDNKETLLKQTDLSVVGNYIFSLTDEEELTSNIYLINKIPEQYLLLYKLNINEESISYRIKDSVLEINVATKNSSDNESDAMYLYEIVTSKDDSYDSIKIIKDDKEVSVHVIAGL